MNLVRKNNRLPHLSGQQPKNINPFLNKYAKTALIIIASGLLWLSTACSVENLVDKLTDCDKDALFKDAVVEKTFYQNALDAYATDQSKTNCDEMKVSGNAYVKAVQKYIDCSGEGNAQIKQELNDAKNALAELNCN